MSLRRGLAGLTSLQLSLSSNLPNDKEDVLPSRTLPSTAIATHQNNLGAFLHLEDALRSLPNLPNPGEAFLDPTEAFQTAEAALENYREVARRYLESVEQLAREIQGPLRALQQTFQESYAQHQEARVEEGPTHQDMLTYCGLAEKYFDRVEMWCRDLMQRSHASHGINVADNSTLDVLRVEIYSKEQDKIAEACSGLWRLLNMLSMQCNDAMQPFWEVDELIEFCILLSRDVMEKEREDWESVIFAHTGLCVHELVGKWEQCQDITDPRSLSIQLQWEQCEQESY